MSTVAYQQKRTANVREKHNKIDDHKSTCEVELKKGSTKNSFSQLGTQLTFCAEHAYEWWQSHWIEFNLKLSWSRILYLQHIYKCWKQVRKSLRKISKRERKKELEEEVWQTPRKYSIEKYEVLLDLVVLCGHGLTEMSRMLLVQSPLRHLSRDFRTDMYKLSTALSTTVSITNKNIMTAEQL